MLDMAWIAAAAEYPDEARQWRDLAAADLQSRIKSGMYGSRVEIQKAKLAMLDQRKRDAIEALERAMALETRMSWLGESPQYASLRDDPRFQTLLNRMLETIAAERKQVVAIRCGPNPIVPTWQPAAETCALCTSDNP